MTTAPSERFDDGFTLVEMLVVLAILGMLALFAFPYAHSRKPSISADIAPALVHLAGRTWKAGCAGSDVRSKHAANALPPPRLGKASSWKRNSASFPRTGIAG